MSHLKTLMWKALCHSPAGGTAARMRKRRKTREQPSVGLEDQGDMEKTITQINLKEGMWKVKTFSIYNILLFFCIFER